MNDKVTENRLRRKARRLDLTLHKSRARNLHYENWGYYMIVDPYRQAVVAGPRYDMDLTEVQEYLDWYEADEKAAVEKLALKMATNAQ